MPRIETGGDFTPRPTGVLKGQIVDFAVHTQFNDLPKMKHLKDTANMAVFEFKVKPDEHERVFSYYVPIKLVLKDGEVFLKESRGVRELNGMLSELGFKIAGIAPKGNCVDEKDKEISLDQLSDILATALTSHPEFRILVHIFKEFNEKDGKHYFRNGLTFAFDNDSGRKFIEGQAIKDLARINKTEPKSPAPSGEPDQQEEIPLKPFSNQY